MNNGRFKSFVLSINFWATLIINCAANRDGAPCSAQNTLQPSPIFHGTAQDIATPPPYTVKIEDSEGNVARTYVPGKVYQCNLPFMKIQAKVHLRGFLIQPRAATKSREPIGRLKVGEFLSDSTWLDQGVQFQQCPTNTNDSVTHVDNKKRKSLVLNWKATSNSGPVQFVLSLVAEQSIFWESWRPESAFLTPDIDNASGDPHEKQSTYVSLSFESESTDTTDKSFEFLSTTYFDVTSTTNNDASVSYVGFTSDSPIDSTTEQQPLSSKKPRRKTKLKRPSSERSSEGDASNKVTTISDLKLSLSKIRQSEFLKHFSAEKFSETGKATEAIETSAPASENSSVRGPCAENECKNGATCETHGSEFKCHCDIGYAGKLCQLQCPTYLCENGGTCTIEGIQYTCICPTGFSGNHCEKSEEKNNSSDSPGRRQKHAELVTSSTLNINNSLSSRESNFSLPLDSTAASSTLEPEKDSSSITSPFTSDSVNLSNAFTNRKIKINVLTTSAASKQTNSEENSKEGEQNEIVKLLKNDRNKESRSREKKRKKGNGSSKRRESGTSDELPQPLINPSVDKLAFKLFNDNGFTIKNGLPNFKNPNPCDEHQCKNGGDCVPVGKTYKCRCYGEYDGPFCQWDCPAYLCKNGGICYIDHTFNYLCHCRAGFNGSHCETKNLTAPRTVEKAELVRTVKRLFDGEPNIAHVIDESFNKTIIDEPIDADFIREIASNQIDATKRAKFIQAANLNKNGTELLQLLIDNDYCSDIFCFNDGRCLVNKTTNKGYCKCAVGWTGDSCDKKNFCHSHKCEHNSVCVNGPQNYTCLCKGEFSGHFCEVACPPSLCSNNGKCFYEEDTYKCICKPGFTGDRCQINIDECASSPCQHGAVCMDKVNGFFCKCKTGYMGQKCHRPCRDVYRQYCPRWKREGHCDEAANTTNFYFENCGLTCGACSRGKNVTKTIYVIPPYLEHLDFLIGKWATNTSDSSSFPLGFSTKEISGYYEELSIVPGDRLLFGRPSLNYSSLIVAHTKNGSMVTLARAGIMSIKYNDSEPIIVLASYGDEGLVIIEEGYINQKEVILVTQSISHESSQLPTKLLPISIKRSLAISGEFLRESLERTFNDSSPEFHTKYYSRSISYDVY